MQLFFLLFSGGSYNPCDKDQSNDPLTQNRHIVYVANCVSDELNIQTIKNQVWIVLTDNQHYSSSC